MLISAQQTISRIALLMLEGLMFLWTDSALAHAITLGDTELATSWRDEGDFTLKKMTFEKSYFAPLPPLLRISND